MKRRKPLSKKAKLGITIGSLTAVVAAIVTGYAVLISEVLLDYENMPYIEFSYSDDAKNKTIKIERVYENSNYPSNFRIPNKLLGYPVTEIGDGAFKNLGRLTKVSVPKTVTRIGDESFYNCANLKTIDFKSVNSLTHIGDDAFALTPFIDAQPNGPVFIGKILYKYNGELEANTAIVPNSTVTVPGAEHYIYLDNYSQIGNGAFKGKENLIYVEYTNKFTDIANNTFEGCSNLEKVVLSSELLSVGSGAFKDCVSLTDVNLSSVTTVKSLGSYAFSNTGFAGELVLSNSITSIEEGAFSKTTNLTSVVLPNTIEKIPASLFEDSGIESVTFTSEETSPKIYEIGNRAFMNTKISEISIPFAVNTIPQSSFEGCDELETVYLYENTTNTYTERETKYIDPDTGEEVTEKIKKYHGVNTIENRAFANTSKLASIITIDKDKQALTATNEVNFPLTTLSKLNRESFLGSGFSKVNIPSKVTKVDEKVFYECLKLEEVNFVASAGTVSKPTNNLAGSAFEGCVKLNNFVVPNTITTLSSAVFARCASLSNITFEEGIKLPSIGKRAFSECTALETIDLPAGLETLDEGAFANSGLTSIVIPSSMIYLKDYLFDGCTTTLKIFLEEGLTPTKSTFRENWNKYKTGGTLGQFHTYVYSETEPAESGDYWHYDSGHNPVIW